MRAMQLHETAPVETGPLRSVSLPDPEPGTGQVRLRVAACGLCHTDLHVVEGELPVQKRPVVPGHQIVGVVDRLGPGVSRPALGARVGVPWLHQTDETCPFCQRGQENLCPNAVFTGYHVNGGLAEYVLAPAGFVYPLPPGFPDLQAAPLLCAGIIGYRALKLAGVQPHPVPRHGPPNSGDVPAFGGPGAPERLGLYGFGASAHLAIQVARHWGCEVYVCTRSTDHRQHALDLGAAWVGGTEDPLPQPIDAAIIFAPAGTLVPPALRALRPGGTLALAGIHMSPIPELDYRLLYGERVLRSVANSTRQDARELLDLATRIPLRTDVTVYPLEAANVGLQDLKHSRFRGAGVVVVGSTE